MNPALLAVLLGVLAAGVAAGASRPRPRPGGRRPPFPVPGATLSRRPALGYLYQRTPTHRHRGIDIPAPEGTPVVTPFAGRVVNANSAYAPGFSGYGKIVVVRVGRSGRPPLWLLFAHLAHVEVSEGQEIRAGQVVGTVGRTAYRRDDRTALFGRSNAHLHFETAEHPYPMGAEAERVDPVPLLGLAA